MPTAILIAFEYTFKTLPGALVDLYHGVTWCRASGLSEAQIHIVTDMREVRDLANLEHVVQRKITDPGLLTFYEPFHHKHCIQDELSFFEALIQILAGGLPDNKLIIYYSGHGVHNSMILPNKSRLAFIDFRDRVLDLLQPYVEIFWILDCCNPNGFHLPYKLEGNTFSLSNFKIECVRQPILLLTSSEPNEKSIATKSGSIFSRYLFRLLTQLNAPHSTSHSTRPISIHQNRNLHRLIGTLASSIRKMHTGYTQTVSVYSSYVVDPVLWMWIGSTSPYDIAIDRRLSTLMLRNYSSTTPTLTPTLTEKRVTRNSVSKHAPALTEKRSTPTPTLTPTPKLTEKRSTAPHKEKRKRKSVPKTKTNPIPLYFNPYDLVYPDP